MLCCYIQISYDSNNKNQEDPDKLWDTDNIEVDSIYQLLQTNRSPDTNALFTVSQKAELSFCKII